jgi:ubiquinone/menaquinone biosynthesis C-methylase UbiE
MQQDYFEKNRQSWNARVDSHLKSSFYDLDGFLSGKSSLQEIELSLLGDVSGKSILHLQCHFGQDSISLARLGAQVTGVDLSDRAIDAAREIAQKVGSSAKFICCNLYDLPNFLDEKFDMVYTSYGTIGWLPDLDKWANLISQFLKPQGKFLIVEFHPVVWMFDDNFEKIAYSYFNAGEIIETEQGTYAEKNANIITENVMWNHSLSELVNALIKNGIELLALDEFDFSPYNCFNHTVALAPNKFRIAHLDNKIPMVFAIEGKRVDRH